MGGGGQYGKRVDFHDGAYRFAWYPASRFVYTRSGGIIADNCYNMNDAKREATKYINRISARDAALSR